MKNTKVKTLIVGLVAVCSAAVLIVNAGDMKTGSSDAMEKPMAAQGQGDMGMENKMHGDADMSAMKKEDMEKEAMSMESEKSMKGSMDKPMKKAME